MGRHARPRTRTPGRLLSRSLVLLGAVSAAGGAIGLGVSLTHDPGAAGPARAQLTAAAPGADPGPVAAQTSAPPLRAAVRPRAVSIPALKVDSSLETLGLSSTGALDVPTNPAQAGWFDGGPVPGQVGPAVVVGHVDSRTGPAVFADLSLLRKGDVITIALSDATSVRFQVTSVQHYPKDRFPTSAVYGAQPDPELRLITCGGPFQAQQYLDDVVVYARLAPAPPSR